MTYFSANALAAMCYSLNREWNRTNNDPVPVDWPYAPEDTKLRYCQMVSMFADGATEEQVHDAARNYLTNTGWTLGSLNREKKTHPYLVPYSQLGLRLRLKYLIYRQLVRAFIENKE